jgi:FlaA1/EpsC-like NDP-sugar epimerase
LVTGAAGSIGSEICRQVLHYAPESLTIVDIAETPMNDLVLELSKIGVMFERVKTYIGDVTRENRINEIFEAVKPEVVFHAAAYKHVPMMENNAKEAVKVNVFGTKLVAQASIQFGVKKFVMISTDKAVNPANVMGATKRSAEILVQSLNTQGKTEFITTRFGNVLGSNGSVIPLFRRQIENREDLTVTHKDIVRYFMTIPEAVQLVLEAGTMGKGGEIFVFDMGKAVRIYDLAEKMVKLSGLTLNQDIRIVETGLRPGEKLYEELLSDAESTIPTHHPKIMIAKVRQYSAETIDPIFNQMTYSSMNGSTDSDMVKLLKQLVPEFISLNSEYSKLD